MTLIDHTGQTFGRLTVIRRAETYIAPNGVRVTQWECLCECGTTKVIRGRHLRLGAIRSCGCLKIDELKSRTKLTVTYSGAHERVRRAKGRPSQYACVDCGNRAQDWSYDHRDPAELTATMPRVDGVPIEVPYSVEVSHYQPRCKKCHGSLDRKEKGARDAALR